MNSGTVGINGMVDRDSRGSPDREKAVVPVVTEERVKRVKRVSK